MSANDTLLQQCQYLPWLSTPILYWGHKKVWPGRDGDLLGICLPNSSLAKQEGQAVLKAWNHSHPFRPFWTQATPAGNTPGLQRQIHIPSQEGKSFLLLADISFHVEQLNKCHALGLSEPLFTLPQVRCTDLCQKNKLGILTSDPAFPFWESTWVLRTVVTGRVQY